MTNLPIYINIVLEKYRTIYYRNCKIEKSSLISDVIVINLEEASEICSLTMKYDTDVIDDDL